MIALVLNPLALLLWMIVLCVLIWAIRALMAAFDLPQPIQTVIYVLIVLFVVLWLVSLFGGVGTPIRIG
jgi:hypothetical protein